MGGTTPEHHVGYYTFMGIYDNLGIEPRTVGGYSDYVYLTVNEPGNIYTAFRGMVLDFGRLGTGVVMLCIGFIGSIASRHQVFSARWALVVYVGVSSFVVWTFVISFWAFTANLLGLAAFPIVQRVFCDRTVKLQKAKDDVEQSIN
ncbi:hypothetical protein GCM10009795_000640 [Nocardioides hankookensis]